jgi:hypothetical protein
MLEQCLQSNKWISSLTTSTVHNKFLIFMMGQPVADDFINRKTYLGCDQFIDVALGVKNLKKAQ